MVQNNLNIRVERSVCGASQMRGKGPWTPCWMLRSPAWITSPPSVRILCNRLFENWYWWFYSWLCWRQNLVCSRWFVFFYHIFSWCTAVWEVCEWIFSVDKSTSGKQCVRLFSKNINWSYSFNPQIWPCWLLSVCVCVYVSACVCMRRPGGLNFLSTRRLVFCPTLLLHV